jgi:hypothetical protein
MAFALYIMRETFNDWSVYFFKTDGGGGVSNQVAAAMLCCALKTNRRLQA